MMGHTLFKKIREFCQMWSGEPWKSKEILISKIIGNQVKETVDIGIVINIL